MRALVTGGSGVVGRALVSHLVACGDQVTVLVRTHQAARIVADLGADSVFGDILDYPSCVAASAGADVVFHVAGLNDMCPKDPHALERVNVEGTRFVVRAAVQTGVTRVVYTSSAAAHETPLSAYGASKLAGEDAAFTEAGDDVDVVSVSPTSVQGPGRSTGTAQLLLAVIHGRLRILPNTVVSIVDIDDCAIAHRQAAVVGTPGTNYLISGATIETRRAADLVAAAGLGRVRIAVVPRWMSRAVVPVASLLPRVRGQRLCADLIRVIAAPHEIDGAPAARELGFSYRSLEDTLNRLAEWDRAGGS